MDRDDNTLPANSLNALSLLCESQFKAFAGALRPEHCRYLFAPELCRISRGRT